ncbi:MAG: phosphate ABC transporter substrate-binding protein [Candidatus Omnitrophica bacterium]|nr:phosphate ABC transporter substrate-binding protein [Candidatus Omnitrophota bacterium]
MKNNYFLCLLVIVLFLSLSSKNTHAEEIKISGSEPMLQLVDILASNYTLKHPGINIDVKGGNTADGVIQLQNGTITIANASSRIQNKDILALMESKRKFIELILAHDNVCVIVNKANPVKALTLEQVRQIYSGEIKNWKQVGGNDSLIVLLGRELSSAQALFFQQKLKIDAYDKSMQQITDAAETEIIKTNAAAIGFVGLAYAKYPAIATLDLALKTGYTPLNPFDQTVISNGIYPLKRKMYQYIPIDKLTPAVKDFLKFECSEAGQAIISANGAWPVPDNENSENLQKLNTL